MKKILVAAAALVWAGSAFAQVQGPIAAGSQHHAPAGLNCSECHVMHASRTHNYNGSTPVDARYNDGVGHPKLLVADGTNATCLACHDAPFGSNTDVFKSVTGSYLNNRSGGALNGAVTGHEDSTIYMDYMGHTLGSQSAPPGWSQTGTYAAGTEGFNCSLCHAVHGGAANAFRNLGGSQWMGPTPLFGDAANPFLTNYPTIPALSLAAGVIDTTVDVMFYESAERPVPAAGSKSAANIIYGKGSGANGGNGMNKYCAVCHGNFHGASVTNAGGEFLKHPTTDSPDIVARMTGTAQFSVTRPVFTANDKSAGEVGCLTCHKAHGNKRAFGIIWPANGAAEVYGTTNYEDGDGTNYQSLCKTCHPQAAAAGLP